MTKKIKQFGKNTYIELEDTHTYDITNAKHILHDDEDDIDIYQLENGAYVFDDGTPLVFLDECRYGLNSMTELIESITKK